LKRNVWRAVIKEAKSRTAEPEMDEEIKKIKGRI
jgi:hypothetical protein